MVFLFANILLVVLAFLDIPLLVVVFCLIRPPGKRVSFLLKAILFSDDLSLLSSTSSSSEMSLTIIAPCDSAQGLGILINFSVFFKVTTKDIVPVAIIFDL